MATTKAAERPATSLGEAKPKAASPKPAPKKAEPKPRASPAKKVQGKVSKPAAKK
ncbi:hypothetical protein HPP92_004856 [Vanilla planifolia]|uniref:Uncharacterized protein n=1 Tax=Vanilla planifolia TaxID=51239 RepID=A0A835RJ63_VANPL|nr:hypothetical protein HPP92_004856 [Vanilla planifolia]